MADTATTRRPCGGPDFGRLPPLYLGEQFRLRFGDATPAVDWTGAIAELTLDAPDGTRVKLTVPDDGEIGDDGDYVIFEKNTAWTVETINQAGDWEWHFWITPPGGERDHQCWGILPVVEAPGGPP